VWRAARAHVGQHVYDINVGQFCCGGLNFGSIIAHGGRAPGYTIYDFTPSTVPGLPDTAYLAVGRHPALRRDGPDFTFLRFNPKLDDGNLLDAAQARGVPLALLDVTTMEPVYAENLVLSRPDQHIARRGNTTPADPVALIDRIRGPGSCLTS